MALTLPTLVINENGPESFRFEGPTALLPPSGAGRLEISPVAYSTDDPIDLRVVDDDGATLTAIRGTLTGFHVGSIGETLVAAFPGGLALRFLMPRDKDGQGSARITCDTEGKDAIAVHRERHAIETAIASSGGMQLWKGEHRMWSLLLADRPPLPVDNDPTLVEDLAVIAKFKEVPLVVPARVTIAERRTIRTLRLLLEGHCVLMPEASNYTLVFKPEGRESVRGILTHGGGWRVEQHWIFPVQGHDLKIEPICLFHPTIRIANAAEVQAALDSDAEVEIRVEIEPTDGTPFRAFLPDLVLDPVTPLVPVSLDIVDLPEHPALEQIRDILASGNGDSEPGD